MIEKIVGKVGFIVKPLTKVATNKKAMMVVDVLFYSSSLIKALCEIARDANKDYETRKEAEEIIRKVTKDELSSWASENRDKTIAQVFLTEREQEFLKSVAEAQKKAEKKTA